MTSAASMDAREQPPATGFVTVDAVPWDTIGRPQSFSTIVAARAVISIESSRNRDRKVSPGRKRPTTSACAQAPSWIPAPEPDPGPSPAMEQFYLSQDFLDAAKDAERAVSKAYAVQARHLDTARQHGDRAAELSDHGTDPGPEFTGWSKSEIGYRGFIASVASELHISENEAETLVVTSTTLVNSLADTLAVLEAGETSYRHAELMAKHSYRVPDEHVAEYEATLIPFAKTLTPIKFDNKARRVADRYIENALAERHKEALRRRSVRVIPCDDGMAEIYLFVDAADAVAIHNRVTEIARGLQHPTDGRTLTELKADVATALLVRGTTASPGAGAPGTSIAGFGFEDTVAGFDPASVGKGKRKGARKGLGVGIVARVAIQVPILSLLDGGTEPATLEGYGPISMDRARQLMGTATSFTRILTHPETGTILSVGQHRYRVPAAMRLFLMTQDQTCRFPGCTTPAEFCDLDHTDDWQYGGDTALVNLVHLCKSHHGLKHHTDWTYTQDEFGVCTWGSPTGATYVTEPETWVKGKPPADPDEPDPSADLAAAPDYGHPDIAHLVGSAMQWPDQTQTDSAPNEPTRPDEVEPPEGFPF